jgi:hypothetical protein
MSLVLLLYAWLTVWDAHQRLRIDAENVVHHRIYTYICMLCNSQFIESAGDEGEVKAVMVVIVVVVVVMDNDMAMCMYIYSRRWMEAF